MRTISDWSRRRRWWRWRRPSPWPDILGAARNDGARPGGAGGNMTPEQNTSLREPRNYPEQPPVIPHTTEGYEVSIHGNKCLSCHARTRVRESEAPMISIPTSPIAMDNSGLDFSRRYFCTQCHVPDNVRLRSTISHIDTLLPRTAPGGRR